MFLQADVSRRVGRMLSSVVGKAGRSEEGTGTVARIAEARVAYAVHAPTYLTNRKT